MKMQQEPAIKESSVPHTHSRTRHWYQTLRARIILGTLAFAVILAALTAGVSYRFFLHSLKQTRHNDIENDLHIVGTEMDTALDRIMTFANWAQLDTALSSYLSAIEQSQAAQLTQKERLISLNTWTILNNEYLSNASYHYIRRVVVMTADGSHFLQCLYDNGSSSVIEPRDDILAAPWFSALADDSDYLWQIENIWRKNTQTTYLPIVRPIQKATSADIAGYIYMEVSPSILIQSLSSLQTEEDAAVYLTLSDATYRVQGETLQKEELPDGTIDYQLPHADITISMLPSSSFYQARQRYYLLITSLIFTVITAAGLLFSLLLRQMITVPVNALLAKTASAAKGDFTRDPSIEWNNELGDIGAGINHLTSSVQILMQQRLQDERRQAELEYQILQSQINPHFLYNTLNTIKWMAQIQGAAGISDVATALSRLLKNVSKGTRNLIPLRDELTLVQDYFTIMKYRYGGTISLDVRIDDDRLLESLVNRFSLQPIVENAIFHGIEPKGKAGTITIHASCVTQENSRLLRIDVTDDGIGMSREQIQKMLHPQEGTQENTDFFRHVGISNVQERIHFAFGPAYGIRIVSEEGKYTTVTMEVPAHMQEDNDERSRNE